MHLLALADWRSFRHHAVLPLRSAATLITGTVNGPRLASSGATLDLVNSLTATMSCPGAPIFGGVRVSGSVSLTALRFLNNHASFGAENGQDHDVFDLRNTDPMPANGFSVVRAIP